MVIEKAKRLVEHKKDVVILLDSITRLARAYNTVHAGLRQGAHRRRRRQRPAEAQALLRRRAQHRGRRLADHHRHRADRHRQPHGRSDLRRVQGHRQHAKSTSIAAWPRSAMYPAVNVNRSGTRREELLLKPDVLQKMWVLRKLLLPAWTTSKRWSSCSTRSRRPRATASSSTPCAAADARASVLRQDDFCLFSRLTAGKGKNSPHRACHKAMTFCSIIPGFPDRPHPPVARLKDKR